MPFTFCIFFFFLILVTSFFALPCLNQHANADGCFSVCRSYCIVSVVQNHSLALVFEKGYKYCVVSDPDLFVVDLRLGMVSDLAVLQMQFFAILAMC